MIENHTARDHVLIAWPCGFLRSPTSGRISQMPPTPKELRIARIEAARSLVERFAAVVTHQTARDALALATRDIEEAAAWVATEGIEKRGSILFIADMALNLAEARIGMVREGVESFGPDFQINV